MGDCYRDYIEAQTKKAWKLPNRPGPAVARTEAEERAALRAEYFRVARSGHRKATKTSMRSRNA